MCVPVCVFSGGSVILNLGGGSTPQWANKQLGWRHTIHPYLACSMPIPLDWIPTSTSEVFSLRGSTETFRCPVLHSSQTELLHDHTTEAF